MPDPLQAWHRCGTRSGLGVDASGKLQHTRPIITVELINVALVWAPVGLNLAVVFPSSNSGEFNVLYDPRRSWTANFFSNMMFLKTFASIAGNDGHLGVTNKKLLGSVLRQCRSRNDKQ